MIQPRFRGRLKLAGTEPGDMARSMASTPKPPAATGTLPGGVQPGKDMSARAPIQLRRLTIAPRRIDPAHGRYSAPFRRFQVPRSCLADSRRERKPRCPARAAVTGFATGRSLEIELFKFPYVGWILHSLTRAPTQLMGRYQLVEKGRSPTEGSMA